MFGIGRVPQLPQERPEAPSDYFGPANFTWLLRGLLGGMPQPGYLRAFDDDADAISRMGVTTVVTLTDEWRMPEEHFLCHGLRNVYVPIPDMAPPEMDQAVAVCDEVAGIIENGGSVAFHCRAGRGRTGTMLAAMLIWYRLEFDTAIRLIKAANKNWIESDAQMSFLEQFSQMLLNGSVVSKSEGGSWA
nr:tyrosine-protein phosphatase [Pseudogemmobacter hezensis]